MEKQSMSQEPIRRIDEEISLPFEHIEADHINGIDLHGAIISQPVNDALDDYTVHSSLEKTLHNYVADNTYESIDDILEQSESAIHLEVNPLTEYSHFAADIIQKTNTPSEKTLEEVENLERGLKNYFSSIDPTSQYQDSFDSLNIIGPRYDD